MISWFSPVIFCGNTEQSVICIAVLKRKPRPMNTKPVSIGNRFALMCHKAEHLFISAVAMIAIKLKTVQISTCMWIFTIFLTLSFTPYLRDHHSHR